MELLVMRVAVSVTAGPKKTQSSSHKGDSDIASIALLLLPLINWLM